MIDTFVVLSPQNFLMTSIGLKMYFLLTKNSARGAVRFSDRLGHTPYDILLNARSPSGEAGSGRKRDYKSWHGGQNGPEHEREEEK